MKLEQATQEFVRQKLATRPVEELPAGFSARLAVRLDEESSSTWLPLLNWRTWSLRLLPAAIVLWVWAALAEQPTGRSGIAGAHLQPTGVSEGLTAWQTGGGMTVLVTSPDVSDSWLLVALVSESTLADTSSGPVINEEKKP